MIVGIDLGTTNSLMAVIEKGRPRLLLSETGSALVPSVIFFAPGRAPVVGDAAKEKKKSAPRQTLYSTKRFMGRGKADIQEWEKILPFDFSPSTAQMVGFRIGDKVFTPIDAAALVLKRLKALGESALAKEVKKAVITVPAYFNDAQRQATKVAGEIAGLEVVRIVNEPTAACLAYGLDKKASGIVAVFDLGGGTFDISILRVSEGVFEVLATNGDTALGGDDFDRLLAEHAAVAFEKQGVDPMVSPEDRALMLVEAERVKKALSDSQSAEFSFKHLSTTVTKAEFEALITPLLEKAMAPCQACLTDAGVTRVSDVILVGGSTRVPAVRDKVKDFFKREPLCSLNPDEVVAVGAAVQANILSGQMGDMLLLDVIPLSLGIETLGGVVNKIIHRNSTVPVSATEQFSTSIDGQVLVDIHVLQGERELVKDNRSLARFQLRIPPLPAGIPKIEVELTVDANGILSVRAVETRTGLSTQVTVNPTYGLTDEEVEKRLMDSFENAESDFEARFLIDAQVEAESVLRSTKKSLEKGSGLLDPTEKASIDSAIARLELALKGTDRKTIKDGVDALAQTTEGFAQKLLNQALQEALKDKQL